MGNKSFKYNSTPKILGVTMDEKLAFSAHVENITRKGHSALSTIREIKGLANMSRDKLLRIYNSLVRSILEYACTVWQITSAESIKKIEALQRKGLSICLGLPATSSREALEVEANEIPIDLRP